LFVSRLSELIVVSQVLAITDSSMCLPTPTGESRAQYQHTEDSLAFVEGLSK